MLVTSGKVCLHCLQVAQSNIKEGSWDHGGMHEYYEGQAGDSPLQRKGMLETMCEFMDIKQEAEDTGAWADPANFLTDHQLVLLVIKQYSTTTVCPWPIHKQMYSTSIFSQIETCSISMMPLLLCHH